MDFLSLNKDNIDAEHICCGFSDKKCRDGYEDKKLWLKEQFDKGYRFIKLDARAKVFIEYCPSEIAYLPVETENFMVINCFWVSGKYKGKGYAKELLNRCIDESRELGKEGIVILSSDKKRPFMSDHKFLIHNGFKLADEKEPYFKLYYLPLKDDVTIPKFIEVSRDNKEPSKKGFVVYYSRTCPFLDYYTKLQEKVAENHGFDFKRILIDSKEDARRLPVPVSIYSLFFNGQFITQEILSENKLIKFIDDMK